MHSKSHYVYMYLRESDLTPYYISSGTCNKMFCINHFVDAPTDLSLIRIVADELSKKDAQELEVKLIKQYGRENNNTGILKNLTDYSEDYLCKDTTVATRRKVNAEERLARTRAKLEERAAKESAKAEKIRIKQESLLARRANRKKIQKLRKEAKLNESAKLAKVQKDKELADQTKAIEQGRAICPVCHHRPVAVNCRKGERTYYRNRCDQCIRAGKYEKKQVAGWLRSGYKKKNRCERCNFQMKVSEQAAVIHVDGNVTNNDWLNLRTVCTNCKVELEHTTSWANEHRSDLLPD